MKKSYYIFIVAILALVSVSCEQNKTELPMSSKLSISVSTSETKGALVTEQYLPDCSEILIWRCENGQLEYPIEYTAKGTGSAQIWESDNPLVLDEDDATIHAFYPGNDDVHCEGSIGFIADSENQVDYMCGKNTNTVNKYQPNAHINLEHLMSAVRLRILKGTYPGPGVITSASLINDIDNFLTKGWFDMSRNEIDIVDYDKKEIISPVIEPITLSDEESIIEFILVPQTLPAEGITISIVLDGTAHYFKASIQELVSGEITDLYLTLNESNFDSPVVKNTLWTVNEEITLQ